MRAAVAGAAVTPDDLRSLGVAGQPFTASPGALIPDTDGEPTRLYAIERGRVTLFHRGPDGREVIQQELEAGDVFGLTGLYGGGAHGPLVRAVTEVHGQSVETAAFLAAARRRPELLLRLLCAVSEKVVEAERQLDRFGSGAARERLAAALASCAEREGQPTGRGAVLLPATLTHAALAHQIGASRETVTRLLGVLEQEHYIQRIHRRVLVRSFPRLLRDFDLADA